MNEPRDPNRFLPEIVGAIVGGVMVVLLVVYVLLQLAKRH